MVRVESPAMVHLGAAKRELILGHWTLLGVILVLVQVQVWAFQQTGMNVQTCFQFRPTGKALL